MLYHEGVITAMFAPPGYGKTFVATKLMEKAVEKRYHVYTVMNFFKPDQINQAIKKGFLLDKYKDPKTGEEVQINYRPKHENIHIVFYLSDLLMGLLTTGKNHFCLDEGAFFAGSADHMQKKVKDMKLLAYTIRKLNSSMMIIAQSKGSVVPALRDELLEYELRIYKETTPFLKDWMRRRDLVIFKRLHEQGLEEESMLVHLGTIKGVRPPIYPVDSKFLPKLTFDIDLKRFYDEIGQYNSMEVRQHAKEILQDLKNKVKK